jgi:hypothetical protein
MLYLENLLNFARFLFWAEKSQLKSGPALRIQMVGEFLFALRGFFSVDP